MTYHIGQIFEEIYPADAAEWCNNNNAYIEEIEPENDIRRFEIMAESEPTPEERRQIFLQDFFKVNVGDQELYYRKKPKGYSSAVESLNTAFNAVSIMQKLPAQMLIFYEEPDFNIPEQCTEEWLIQHQIFNDEMSIQEFGAFYVEFMTAWNTQEHN